MPATDSTVALGLVLPDVLGTYGDAGNAMVLRRRLEWRGIPARTISIRVGDPVPESLDLYLLGGGEDSAQALAAHHLRTHRGVQRAAARGAVVLGVCAGLQILGTWFQTTDGVRHQGLGLLDLTTQPGRRRAVGDVVVTPDARFGTAPVLGFENHRGRTTIGPGSIPVGRVRKGRGNGNRTEGATTGHVLGTYLHGPVLAVNPSLADLLLGWALGYRLPPLRIPEVDHLRRTRLGHRPQETS